MPRPATFVNRNYYYLVIFSLFPPDHPRAAASRPHVTPHATRASAPRAGLVLQHQQADAGQTSVFTAVGTADPDTAHHHIF